MIQLFLIYTRINVKDLYLFYRNAMKENEKINGLHHYASESRSKGNPSGESAIEREYMKCTDPI